MLPRSGSRAGCRRRGTTGSPRPGSPTRRRRCPAPRAARWCWAARGGSAAAAPACRPRSPPRRRAPRAPRHDRAHQSDHARDLRDRDRDHHRQQAAAHSETRPIASRIAGIAIARPSRASRSRRASGGSPRPGRPRGPTAMLSAATAMPMISDTARRRPRGCRRRGRAKSVPIQWTKAASVPSAAGACWRCRARGCGWSGRSRPARACRQRRQQHDGRHQQQHGGAEQDAAVAAQLGEHARPARRRGGAAAGRRARSAPRSIADPRVEQRVGEVDHEVDQHVHEGEQENHRLDRR